MKFLILGHGRHGKDTVAQMLQDKLGLTYGSSSRVALDEVIWPHFKHRYRSKEACFADRHNKRTRWHNLIREYNTPDRTKLARKVLSRYDCYVGMRCKRELSASRHLFDLVIWVDGSARHPAESPSSCTVTSAMADIVLKNQTTRQDLSDAIGLIFVRRQIRSRESLKEYFDDFRPKPPQRYRRCGSSRVKR